MSRTRPSISRAKSELTLAQSIREPARCDSDRSVGGKADVVRFHDCSGNDLHRSGIVHQRVNVGFRDVDHYIFLGGLRATMSTSIKAKLTQYRSFPLGRPC